MESNDKPFKKETIGSKVLIVVTIAILLLTSVGAVFAVYYFGILGVFNLLGVEYDSLFSLLLFVIFYFLLGLLGDIVQKAFIILISSLSINHYATKLVEFSIYLLVNWSIISFLNFLMQSIHVEMLTQVIAAAIIALIEFTLENYDKKKS